MSIELVHIGFGNILAMSRAIAIASPNSAPTKRIIHEGRNNGKVIDMTSGRRTKAVIFTDSGHIILAALAPETIASRLQASRTGMPAKQEQSDGTDELENRSPLSPPAKPLLIVLSGLSGVGKDSVLNGLRKSGLPLYISVSATTRPRRAGEKDGVDYHFVSAAKIPGND